MKYQCLLTTVVTGEPTVDQLIRHLQAELDSVSEISDVQAREQRQWQIESTIQEGLVFLQKYQERENSGIRKILAEKEPVRVIKSTEDSQAKSKDDSDDDSTLCPECGTTMEAGLGFCPSCGEYL